MTSYLLYDINNNKIIETVTDEVLDKIYYQEARVPTKEQIGDKYLENKINISKIDNKIPLYDEFTKNMYLINSENVYSRVVHQYYRFPDKNLTAIFENRLNKLKKQKTLGRSDKIYKNLADFTKSTKIHYKQLAVQREQRKLTLILDYLNQFDYDTLLDTYIKVFYYYANEVGKNITVCLRPSFLPHFSHISPYYSRTELINMALNMELIKPSNIYYDTDKLMKLCEAVSKNDINSDVLLDHQVYIIKNKKVGLVQYYSLQGSFFINQYMRGFTQYKYKNEVLEQLILSLWNFILDAPAFDKNYTLYRFIKDDTHLRDLSPGDIYTDPGFVSTTRDPFYRSEEYKFGYILMKIKIPKRIKGVALCIETVSHFSNEQEVLLPPLSRLKLVKKNISVPYYHTDEQYKTKFRTRYEFILEGSNPIEFPKRSVYDVPINIIDFLDLEKTDYLTVDERIRHFIQKYVTPFYQFKTKIGSNVYDIICEFYDSTTVYKNFYAAKVQNGFIMYTMINDFIGFIAEIGEGSNGSYIYVNYYFRYSSEPKQNLIDDKDLIDFISKLSYYFQIQTVTVYSRYRSCNFADEIEAVMEKGQTKKIYYGGNYNVDFYNYLKRNEKRFSKVDSLVVRPKFSYYLLDVLKKIDPEKIIKKEDRDEIYQIYTKIYKLENKSKFNLSDFMIWLVENYCYQVSTLVSKMNRLFNQDNPFDLDYYNLDGITYLYNKRLIENFPIFNSSSAEGPSDDKSLPKNEYRLTRNIYGRS